MAKIANSRFQLKRGLAEAWERNNPVLLSGEPGWASDTQVLKIGDGTTPWNELEPLANEDIIRAIALQEVEKLVDGAPGALDTLKEVANWIDNAEDSVVSLANQVIQNTQNIDSMSKQIFVSTLESDVCIIFDAGTSTTVI